MIQDCEYVFLRKEDGVKEMEVRGKSLHILGGRETVLSPLNFQEKMGIEFLITMLPSGQKDMNLFLRQVDFHYHPASLPPLLAYFVLPDSCYPPQTTFPDLPLLRCNAYLLNSYYRLVANQEHVYALKGDLKVVWTRPQLPHPQTYAANGGVFPEGRVGSSYDIELKDVSLRKYKRAAYEGKINSYRSLSAPITLALTLNNLMRLSNDHSRTDLQGNYSIQALHLKLSYKEVEDLQAGLAPAPPPDQQEEPQPQPAPPAVPQQSMHKVKLEHFSLEVGVSELPVSLLDLGL